MKDEEKNNGIMIDDEGNPYYLSDEETETAEASGTESAPSESKDTQTVEIPDKYKGKTQEELIKIMLDQEKMIGRQGNELGSLKKKVESNPFFKSDDEYDLNAIDTQMKRMQDKLDSLDEFDDDERSRLNKKISELDRKKVAAEAELNVMRKYSEKDNADRFVEFKREISGMTDEITPEIYDEIYSFAKNKLADNYGRIDNNDLHAAAAKLLGSAFISLVQKNAEMKIRKETSTNNSLVTPGVSTSKSNNRVYINTKDPEAMANEVYKRGGQKALDELLQKRGVPISSKR